jgi:hypothetical protein
MARHGDQAARDQRQSREWGERAREMAERMTPEQRRQMEQLAREAAEGMTPEERQRMAERGRDMAREMGQPSEESSQPSSRDGTSERGAAEGESNHESSRDVTSRTAQQREGGMSAGARDGRDTLGPIRDAESGRDVDVIDARRPPTQQRDPRRERVVGELFNSDGRPAQGMSRDDVTSILQQAARDGEQAIEDRSVPARYDRLLRRYFQRLPARALPGSSPAEVAPLAPDAAPSTGPSP